MKKVVLFIISACFVFCFAQAQNKPTRGNGPEVKQDFKFKKPTKADHLERVDNEVLGKMKLSDKQKQKVKNFYAELLDEISNQQKNNAKPSKEIMDKTMSNFRKSMKDLLGEEQYKNWLLIESKPPSNSPHLQNQPQK